jgi:acyl-CoA thioester hydrolase
VNRYLIDHGRLDPNGTSPIGLVVETGCQYFSSISFPDEVHVGLRVAEIGRSSVRYELAVFREQEVEASATGHFVHVYVDRESRRPTPVPEKLQKILRPLLGIATAA